MSLNPAILSALLRKKRRDKGREDIEFFLEYYLGHYLDNKTPAFHKEIRKNLFTEHRYGIAAPRGFAKSTNVQVIYALHCLMYNVGDDILTISASGTLAEDWVRKLKFELEGNERLKEDFQPLLSWGERDSKRWTTNHLVIQRGNQIHSQIRARGRGCQVRGLRPTRVFCDDLEDDELVRSDEQRRILKDWFLSALFNVLKVDQQLVFIGTILHPLSLLADIVKHREQFEEWKVKKYVAIQEDGTSLWQDRFPVVNLLKTKKEIGTYSFEKEFQNNPIAADTCLWKPDWIRTYEKLPKIKLKFIVLDPAISEKEKADYSALCCMGISEDNFIYEVETIRGHWGTWELVNHCLDFYKKHEPIRFGIEEIAFQSVLRPIIQKEARKRGLVLPLEKIALGTYSDSEKKRKQPKDKYTRAFSVIHYWEQSLVFLKTQDLIDEVSLFPTGSHDDMVDACVWCMKMIMKHNPVAVIINKPLINRRITNPTVVNNTIPCFAPPPTFEPYRGNWKIG